MKEWEAKFIKKRIRDCIADMNGKEVSSGSGRTQSNNNKKNNNGGSTGISHASGSPLTDGNGGNSNGNSRSRSRSRKSSGTTGGLLKSRRCL